MEATLASCVILSRRGPTSGESGSAGELLELGTVRCSVSRWRGVIAGRQIARQEMVKHELIGTAVL